MNDINQLIEMPLKPTWQRYKNIFIKQSNISIYRALEYEALSKIQYTGRILDFGGGEKAHYLPYLKKWMSNGIYESINISEEMDPTYLVSPDDDLPVESSSFDMVISINTLEHVYELDRTLMELARVLKPGGRIVIAVPFLFRMHACPDDFNRPTASWWKESISRYNVKKIRITPLVWDFMTTGLSVVEGAGPFSKLRKIFVPLYGLIYSHLRTRGKDECYPSRIGLALSDVALGYVITGVKEA